jgi:hypothetical protein
MTDNRLLAACLRPLVGLIALAGVLTLSACGGGSGAPNNPYAPGPSTPGPLSVLPATATAYSGVPTTLTVTGGVPPYLAFTSDSAVLPVAQSVAGSSILLLAGGVASDTLTTITVQDAALSKATAAVTVRPAPLLPNLITIVPNGDCAIGAATLCSGGTGTASVVVTGPGGGGIAGRQVRFDVIAGAFQIQTPNPAQPLASTLTVISDANGSAAVGLAVNANAPTQIASIRATDVSSSNQVTGQFLIQQVTDGSQILSVIPDGLTTIDGPSPTACSSGVSVVYHVYGGTPPYQVSAPFAGAVIISGVPVATNGGSFTATTTGVCFTAMQFAITDATGRTIPGGSSPTLTNQFGTGSSTPPSTSLTVSPSSIVGGACTGKTFSFVVVGGTAPYSVSASPTGPIIAPSPVPTAGTPVLVSGPFPSGTTTITFVDSSSPAAIGSGTITCN